MVRRISISVAVMISLAACDSSSDPPAGVYQVNGKQTATAAYAGPGALCCDQNGMANVAWQVWFTNTESCPANKTMATATLLIISPSKVTPPSTALPDLGGTTELSITTAPADVTTPIAQLHDTGRFVAPVGTLTLTTFDETTVEGSFTATGTDSADVEYAFASNFTATTCASISD